jgi:hypothetical protein
MEVSGTLTPQASGKPHGTHWTGGWVGCGVEKKSLAPAGNQTLAAQAIACPYIDWTIPASPREGEVAKKVRHSL